MCRAQFTGFFRYSLWDTFCCAVIFTAIGLAGCRNSCFVGVSNNGNGSVIVKAGDPPPVCSLSQANGAVRAVALKSPVCESCTASARVEHVFVTLRSIQLCPSATADPNSPDWLEIVPHLANEPRQIDFMGRSMPEILVESAMIPAGNYRQIRLQFLADSPANAEKLPADNACGQTRWNCIVMADGHVEPLHLPGDVPEILITTQSREIDSLVVWPDTRMDLWLSLEPRQVVYSSGTERWKPQNVLVGRVTAVRQSPSQ